MELGTVIRSSSAQRIETHSYEAAISLAVHHKIEVTEQLHSGLVFADSYSRKLQQITGLPDDPLDVKTILLDEIDFRNLKLSLPHSVTDDSIGYGLSAYPYPYVFVRNDPTMPAYFTSSIVLHERIHQDIEGHPLSRQPEIGDFLNEMGNMVWQRNFIKDLLNEPAFRQDRVQREYLLKANGMYPEVPKSVTCGQDAFYFWPENIHFDINGELLSNEHMNFSVMAQLVDDLYSLTGHIEGHPLDEILLRIKVSSTYIQPLREAIDSVLGKGFTSRLQHSRYAARPAMALLQEVQAAHLNSSKDIVL